MDPVRNPQAPEPAPMNGARSARQILTDVARECGRTVQYFVEQYNMECNRQGPEYEANLVRNFTNPGLSAVSKPSPLCIVLALYPEDLLILTLQPFTETSWKPHHLWQLSPAQHGK